MRGLPFQKGHQHGQARVISSLPGLVYDLSISQCKSFSGIPSQGFSCCFVTACRHGDLLSGHAPLSPDPAQIAEKPGHGILIPGFLPLILSAGTHEQKIQAQAVAAIFPAQILRRQRKSIADSFCHTIQHLPACPACLTGFSERTFPFLRTSFHRRPVIIFTFQMIICFHSLHHRVFRRQRCRKGFIKKPVHRLFTISTFFL